MSSSAKVGVRLPEIAAMLERFRAFREETKARELARFEAGFERVRRELEPLRAEAAERARLEAPSFNVFRILRLQRREVTTHTPFLANLLDPQGTHAQGELFLSLFWQRLTAGQDESNFPVRVPAFIPHRRWIVHAERVMELGNFDIHLRCRSLGIQVVIENKIDANDQSDQLDRYWRQMEREKHAYPNCLLVYLTPHPRKPGNTGCKLPPFSNLTYHADIRTMLSDACKHIHAPRLRATLEQYLDIIETL